MDSVPEGGGWLPVNVNWLDGEATVQWRWLGRRRLIEPFFVDTIRIMERDPYTRFVRAATSLEAMEREAAARPGLPLIGLIAHVSRCGSTLVSQMLASLDSLVVASEPPPLNAVLRDGPEHMDPALRLRWLRAMASLLGQRRTGNETGLVIKLDSWHLADLARLRAAFPTAPLVVLYRDPTAVLASQMREHGLQMAGVMSGPPFDGLPFPGPSQLEYRARVLGRIFDAAARAPEDALVLSYQELPAAVATKVAPWFGLRLDSAHLEGMQRVEKRDAKSPGNAFAPRDDDARDAGEIKSAAERWAGRSYRILESRRGRM